MKKLTPELEQELRQSIKPNYADVRGTASHERSALFEEIDMLRAAIAAILETTKANPPQPAADEQAPAMSLSCS